MAQGILQVRERGSRISKGGIVCLMKKYRYENIAQGILLVGEHGSRNTTGGIVWLREYYR